LVPGPSTTGIVTGWIKDLSGVDIWNHGFTLHSAYGVFFVYMYFQIPLMVLVILPALVGLRSAWREAAQNLGVASSWQYWRYAGGPVLLPSFLGCLLLLSGSAFAAYATAEALTGGTIALTPTLVDGKDMLPVPATRGVTWAWCSRATKLSASATAFRPVVMADGPWLVSGGAVLLLDVLAKGRDRDETPCEAAGQP